MNITRENKDEGKETRHIEEMNANPLSKLGQQETDVIVL